MGPHAQYYTDRIYPLFIKAIGLFYEDVYQQDIQHADYARFINALDKLLASYTESKIIYSAGHDHNLQAFGSPADRPPQYRLVSGSGSLDKVTGVGHNDKTIFAAAQHGFMAIEVYAEGVILKAYTALDRKEVFSHWLWKNWDRKLIVRRVYGAPSNSSLKPYLAWRPMAIVSKTPTPVLPQVLSAVTTWWVCKNW